MENKPTEAELKEFWEWCRFKYEDYNTPFVPHQGGQWVDAIGQPVFDNNGELPPLDLDSLFKYAVPKLLDKELSVSITVNIANSLAIIRDKFDKTPAFWKENHREHPALALFRAIQEVMKNDK